MNKIKKTPMLVACLLLASSVIAVSFAVLPSKVEAGDLSDDYEDHGTFSITGSSIIECKPELLIIFLRVIGFDADSAEKARDEAATIIAEVLEALDDLGISDDDIETTSYNIHPKYEWENRKRVFKGYEVTATIKVTLKDFSKGGKVIDSAVDSGALVDSISFSLTRETRDELKLQALAEAAKDAKNKAETILIALGEELGGVISVDLNDNSYAPYKYWDRNLAMLDGASEKDITPPTTIMPTDLTVSANVNVVFEIL